MLLTYAGVDLHHIIDNDNDEKKGNASDEHSIARNDVVGPSSSRTIEQFNTSSYLKNELC